MGGHVLRARQLLADTLDGLPESERPRAARAAVAELGAPDRLAPLLRELAADPGAASGRAALSYRHVLGFDKLLLIDDSPRHMLRAHVWHPGVRVPGQDDIHNHRSPLASYVVRGGLGMELYEVVGDGGVAAARYRESLSPEAADWLLEPAGRARLRLTQIAEFAAGSGYALSAYALHRAWCTAAEPTVTLFLETGPERRQFTDVFTEAGGGAHAEAVAKAPLEVTEYGRALVGLAELIGG